MNINTKENPKVLSNYLDYLYRIKNYSLKTIQSYQTDLIIFFKFIIKYLELPIRTKDINVFILANLKSSDIIAFLIFLNYNRNNSPATRKRRVSAIKSFFKWLFNYYPTFDTKNNPILNLPKINLMYRLPKYLTLEDAIRIQDIFNNSNSRFYLRNNLIIKLFLNTGMRLSELININIKDINLKQKTIYIIGKRNKERTIFLNSSCVSDITKYLNTRKVLDLNEALFINQFGKRLSEDSIENICKTAFKLAGLEEYNFTVHTLRHTAATHLYDYTKDILIVKEFLGHESISSTEVYAHICNEEVKKAVNSNPLANFKI